MATTRVNWTDSTSIGVTNHKIYRDDVLLITLGVGVETYDDTTASAGITYKYEVQAVSAGGESTTETIGVNTQNITMAGADVTAPTLSTITIEDAAPTNVVMVFDESVTGTNLGFTLSGTTSTTFASISGSGTTWTGVLATAAANGETILLSYNSVTGDFADTSSNDLASITNQAVTNNVAASYSPHLQAGIQLALTSDVVLPIDVSQAADGSGGNPIVTITNNPSNLDGWNTFVAASSERTKLTTNYSGVLSTPFTYCIYLKPTNITQSSTQYMYDGGGGSTSLALKATNNTDIRPTGVTATAINTSDEFAVGVPVLLTCIRDSSDNVTYQFDNGTVNTATGSPLTAELKFESFGGRTVNDLFADMSIGRLIVFNVELTGADLTNAKNWVIAGDTV